MILLWAGCPEPVGTPPHETLAWQPPGCEADGPCSAELATAVWASGPASGWLGFELTAGTWDGQHVVLAGAPLAPVNPPALPSVVALRAPDLSWIGSFEDADPNGSGANSDFGQSVAISPDGLRFAVGASDGAQTNQQEGVVYVMERLPLGLEPVDPILTIYGDLHWLANLGVEVLYLDLAGEGLELVTAAGNAQPDYANGIYRFDPSLRGEHGLDSARASITGGYRLGQQMAGWDGDLDGLDELVSIVPEGVAHFDTPWTGDLLQEDADVIWADSHPENQLGETIEVVGDLDGDGQDELALGAQTHRGPQERSGALFLVTAGALVSSPAAELPIQILGTELGEGVGSAATSGDYDGDGVNDLGVGAYGVFPGWQTGKVLGYLGPLSPGVRTPADADFAVHGEHVHDWFGSDVVTVDADGDARADLVVGAQGWNEGMGKVYLLLGRDLL